MARGGSSSKVRFVQDSSSPFVPSLLTTLLPKSSRNCTKAAGTKSSASGKKSASQPNVPTPSTSASGTMKPKTLSARQIANMAFPGEEEDLKPIRRPLPSALPYPSDSEVSPSHSSDGKHLHFQEHRTFCKDQRRTNFSFFFTLVFLSLVIRPKEVVDIIARRGVLSFSSISVYFCQSRFLSAELSSLAKEESTRRSAHCPKASSTI